MTIERWEEFACNPHRRILAMDWVKTAAVMCLNRVPKWHKYALQVESLPRFYHFHAIQKQHYNVLSEIHGKMRYKWESDTWNAGQRVYDETDIRPAWTVSRIWTRRIGETQTQYLQKLMYLCQVCFATMPVDAQINTFFDLRKSVDELFERFGV